MAEGDEVMPKDLSRRFAGMSNGMVEGESELDGRKVPFTADFREDRREFERRYITRCLEHTGKRNARVLRFWTCTGSRSAQVEAARTRSSLCFGEQRHAR